MAKKKTNGFHLFANSRRSAYEQQSGGRRLSQKMIIEMASNEWNNLTKAEQAAWLSRPKMSATAAGRQQTNPFVDHGNRQTTGRGGGGGENARGTQIPGHASQAHVKKSHVVEQELFKRTYKTGLDRNTAREEFYGNLLWREKDRLDDIINRRWGVVVLSAEGDIVANEIICLCMENSKIVSEMRIHRPEAKIQPSEKLHNLDCLWNIDKPEDINTACVRMNRFLQSCCYNYILVPAHQQHELSAILHQMKKTRDDLHNRDTQSIRLDRLICIEDAVHMLRKLRNLPLVNNEVDLKWEQLTGEWHQMTPLRHARAVAKYFLGSLEPETAYFDEEEERELQRREREQLAAEERAKQEREEKEKAAAAARQQQLEEEQKQREKEKASWVTVSPDGCRFTHNDSQATPRFTMSQLMSTPPLTPVDHISPRFRRPPLPRRWRSDGSSPQDLPSFSQSSSYYPCPPAPPPSPAVHRGPPPGLPQPTAEWNPFSQPPQIVQNTQQILFQQVNRWLETVSLDPPPMEEEEDLHGHSQIEIS